MGDCICYRKTELVLNLVSILMLFLEFVFYYYYGRFDVGSHTHTYVLLDFLQFECFVLEMM